MQTLWLLVIIATCFATVKSDAQDLRVDVVPVQRRYGAADDVNVVLQYTNLGIKTLRLYQWSCPDQELNDPLFTVSLYGKPVDYVGRLIKRGEPKEGDLIKLEPGSTISCLIDLSSAYDMTRTGHYAIRFQRWPEQVISPTRNTRGDIILVSPRIVVFVVGHPNQRVNGVNQAQSLFRELPPTLVNCTGYDVTPLMDALKTAEAYAGNAVDYFDTKKTATTRYTTWFGKYSAANWDELKGDYTRILVALIGQTLTFNCFCDIDNAASTFAFVYKSEAYTIYLCGEFWKAPVNGSNSKAGTIIHELSHFNVVAAADDVTYGEDGAKALAKKNPAKAITNADNIEYFAENTPPLN